MSNIVKEFRKDNGYTQQELAKLLGVNQTKISRLESGVHEIPEWIVKLIECVRNGHAN